MKIQLTKDKTIDVNIPLAGGSGGVKSDIVGVELFSGCERGCPAVRLKRKKSGWTLEAADYVPAPKGELPGRWDDMPHQPTWSMPRQFQANSAALAVNTAMGSFSQASTEAIIQEMMCGNTVAAEAAARSSAGRSKFAIKRPEQTVSSQQVANGKRPSPPPDTGAPVSENGRRFVVRPLADEGFKLCASMPEFQALWLGRLLPEGHRPTASSIQLAESALMASVLVQPDFIESEGNALAVFVRSNAIYFGGYKGGECILWRKCPGICGYSAIQQSVMRMLGLTAELVDSALEDSLIDTRPALEPVLHPVLEQLELARAYLFGRYGMNHDKVLLLGMPRGADQLKRYAEDTLRLQLVAADPLAGLTLARGVSVSEPSDFLVAIGAAVAASEAEI